MPKYKVETMEKWNRLSTWLRENGYKPWQYEGGSWSETGLLARFSKAGCEDVEIVTHSEIVHKAVYKYGSAD